MVTFVLGSGIVGAGRLMEVILKINYYHDRRRRRCLRKGAVEATDILRPAETAPVATDFLEVIDD